MRVFFEFTNGAGAPSAAPVELGQNLTADDTQTFRGIWRRLEQIGGAAFNVGPKYFANLDDADRERRRIAKQLFNGPEIDREIYFEKLQKYVAGQTHCAWCENSISEMRRVEAVGDRLLHTACARHFDAFVADRLHDITEADVEAMLFGSTAALRSLVAP
jgi:hypothetical protein